MAHNDMYVVMYKIIAYLYDCMKKGKEPQETVWNAQALGIPQSYWQQIIAELVGAHYISGVNIFYSDSDLSVIVAEHPYVTMEGVAFAQENSMMGRAKSFLQEAKAAIPFL